MLHRNRASKTAFIANLLASVYSYGVELSERGYKEVDWAGNNRLFAAM